MLKKKILKNVKFVYIAILLTLSFMQLVYAFRTNEYFSVDDFQVLAYFKNHTVGQMIPDFLLHGDVFGYRKITGYIVFGELFKNFGTNPNYFTGTLFLFHTANLILLFFIVRYMVKDDFVSFFVSVVFNKYYLFYYSNIHEILGAFFSLLAIYLFLKFPKKIYFSVAGYLLALLSKELAYSLPFFLLAIAFINKTEKRKVIPYFAILGTYVLFQAYLMYVGRFSAFVSSYGATSNFNNLVSAFNFYFGPLLVGSLVLFALLRKKYKTLFIFGVSLITILPVLFFGARREAYYLYIPMIYLLIYLSLLLPKITLKTSIIYLIILLLFGGRAVFPKIAWQVFPNWQKVSIENVVGKIEISLQDGPNKAEISLGDITLERDAKLMLRNGLLDVFVRKDVSGQYVFSYNESENVVTAMKK